MVTGHIDTTADDHHHHLAEKMDDADISNGIMVIISCVDVTISMIIIVTAVSEIANRKLAKMCGFLKLCVTFIQNLEITQPTA